MKLSPEAKEALIERQMALLVPELRRKVTESIDDGTWVKSDRIEFSYFINLVPILRQECKPRLWFNPSTWRSGYQPMNSNLDLKKPPQGGSGVPRKGRAK